MRLFLAVLPPESAIQELDDAVHHLRRLSHADGLRWTGRRTWHLTLAFLGHVDADQLAALEPRLAHAAREHPVHALRIAGAGRFGDRALWAGVQGDTLALRKLADHVADASRRSDIAVDDRPYKPHLTLARSGSARTDLRPFVEAMGEFSGAEWSAASLHLMRSHLGAGPAHYETVTEWPLTGDA